MGGREGRAGRGSGFRIEVEKRAQKTIARLPPADRRHIVEAINALADDPLPVGCEPVVMAEKGTYRVRVGNYRIVYVLLSDERVVIIARVSKRDEYTYKRLR